MPVPQVGPLHWGKIGVAQVVRGPDPGEAQGEGTEQRILVPVGVADEGGQWPGGDRVQKVLKEALTWRREEASELVNRLPGVVEPYLGRPGRELADLRTEKCLALKRTIASAASYLSWSRRERAAY